MNILELKDAGFNEQEIGEYVSDKRTTLLQADFNDTEINNYFGIDSNTPEFAGVKDSKSVSEKTGKIWDKGTELNVPVNTIRENYNEIFSVPDPVNAPMADLPDTEFKPFAKEMENIKNIPPDERYLHPEQSFFDVAPEHTDLMESIFGYTGTKKDEEYWKMSQIKRAAFDVYMAGRHLFTRTGGIAARETGIVDKKEVQDLYNDELINNPKWYQYSPEVLGWTAEKTMEYYALKGLWKATGLHRLFSWVGETAAYPFLAKEITTRGGAQTLTILSKEGLKQLGKDAVTSFLRFAPENTAFLASWNGISAKLKDEDVTEAMYSGGLWGMGLTALTSTSGPVGKIFLATPAGDKLKTISIEAYNSLWRNYPRIMNAGRKPFSDEFMNEAKKQFRARFGIEPTAADEAALSEMTRRVGDEITKMAEKDAVVSAYWNSGKQAADDVVKTGKEIVKPEEKPSTLAPEVKTPAEPIQTKPIIPKDFESYWRDFLTDLTPKNQAKWDSLGDVEKQKIKESVRETHRLELDNQNNRPVDTQTSENRIRVLRDFEEGGRLLFNSTTGTFEFENKPIQPAPVTGQGGGIETIPKAIRLTDDSFVHPSARTKGKIQVTYFTKEGKKVPAGHDEYNTLQEALEDNFEKIDHPVFRRFSRAEDAINWFGEALTNENIKHIREGKKYIYISPLRPLAGVRIEGVYTDVDRGTKSVLWSDNPITLEKQEHLSLFPYSTESINSAVKEYVETKQEEFTGIKSAPPQARQPYEMTETELDNLITTTKIQDRNVEIELFGKEGAKKYASLYKKANQITDLAGADKATVELEKMQNSLTPKQQDKLFGIGEFGVQNIESLKEFRRAISDVGGDTPQELGESLKTAVTDIGNKTDPSTMNQTELKAYMALKEGFRIAQENGWDIKEVSEYAIKASAVRFVDSEDALFMLQRFAKSKIPQVLAEYPELGKPEQAKVDEFIDNIKKPKRGKLEKGMIDISGATEAVKEIVQNGINYAQETYETAKDAIEALKFYPNVPMELRNAIRTDIIGAGNQAGHKIYGQLSPVLMGNLGREDIEKAAQIFYAKDEIARTKTGKGNPDLTVEDAQRNYDELVAGSSPEVLKVVENLEKIQKTYTDVLIKRGSLDPDALLEDYARHYVMDYTPDWAFKRGLPPLRLRTPFRGYTKEAVGTKKEYYRTMDSILFSFYEKELDNIVADFIEEQTAKYNILPTLSREQKIKLFGANERGTPNKPKHGRIVEINGKKYRSFSPDAPFTRTFYRTENGEMAMGGLKHISLIPKDIADAFNAFSQRGGAIVARINQITRMWKSMAILSHYMGFTLNNMVGDTFVALMQHPEPDKLIAEYSTAIKYLAGKGEGQFYKDLEKFITDHDIVKGMLTSAELAHFRNNANPFNIIMNALQGFSEKREALNRVAYACSLLRAQQAGQGNAMVEAHDWIDTQGLDETSALGKIARDVEVDYKWVSKGWARYVSGMAAPFGTWYFKMSNNVWRWSLKHWGKALVTFLAAPVAATFYNDRSEKSRKLEKGLPDSIRNRVHFVLGETPDGKTRVISLQLPQDALIGTKIFTIATSYVNRVALGEMTVEEAAINALKDWGYKETAGMVSLMSPLGRFIYGLSSADRKDPYDKSPVYSKDPKELTAWEYRKQTALYGIKCMTPFLSASISSYEKGLPQSMAWSQALDTIIGKRAFGIYDINPKSEIEVELEDGKKIKLSWEDNARIEWVYQQEGHILDHFEDAFVASGKNPDEFYKTSGAQKQLLNVHKLWNDFAPDLNKNTNDTQKAEFVVNQLGERLINRMYSAGTLSKWYQVKLDKAKTDEEKTKLGQEYKRLMGFKIEEAIKGQPKTARQTYMAVKIKDSNMPAELLWKMP